MFIQGPSLERKKILVSEPFKAGDEVVLADGTYPGTPGVFLRLREDVKWADITERDGRVRSHPVLWLAHSTAKA